MKVKITTIMIRTILYMLCVLTCPHMLFAQLLQTTWQQNIIHDYKGVAGIKGIVQDDEGNIYTLAYVENGQIGTQTVAYKDGPIYLLKTDKNGNIQRLASLQDNTSGPGASLGIDKWGNILIGGSFRYELVVNGERLAYTNRDAFGGNDEIHAFLLKLDEMGGVVWFRDYPSSHTANIDNILTDEDGNIYAHMQYSGRLMLDGVIIDNDSNGFRSYCIVKMSAQSHTLWYYTAIGGTADYFPPVMKLYKPKPDCPQQLLIAWMVPDTMYSSLYTNILHEFSPDGKEVRNYSFFTSGWRVVDAIETVGEKVYVAGSFIGNEAIGGVALHSRNGGVYLAELNELLQPQSVKKVMESRPYGFASVTSLKYTDRYGLVMTATFADTFTTDAGSYHSASYSYTPGLNSAARGTVLFSFGQDMRISDMQYVDGKDCVVKDFFPVDDELALAVWHNGYNPITGSTYDNGYTICKTRMKKQDSWAIYESEKKQDYTVYPMPFINTCHIRFNTPIYGYRYYICNSAGQHIKDVKMSIYNDTTIYLEMSEQPAGIYFLKMEDCCDRHITVKLSKL